MKLSLNVEVKDFKGEVMFEDDSNKIALTVLKVCLSVLGRALDGDVKMKGEEKLKLFKLGMKLTDSGEVELSSEDIVLIKNRVNKIYSPIVYGRCCEVLEGSVDVPAK